MKNVKSIGLSLLIATGTVAASRGETFRTDINPALLYYQAFLVAPDPLSDADYDFLGSREGRGQKLPERFDKLFARYDSQFKLVRQAAQATVPCDWGIDMSEGPATLLPHLARTKAVAQAAKLRVPWHLQHGRQADARDDLLASFTLGRNVARDGTLISALVQTAVEAISYAAVPENFGRFSPETLKQLVDGFDAAPARRTVAACVPTEKAFFRDWMLRRMLELQKANPNDDAKAMAGIHELLAGMINLPEEPARARLNNGGSNQADWWGRLTQAAGGTSDGVIKLVHELEPFDEKLAVIMALPYGEYEGRMKQFQTEIKQSANPLAALVYPGWERGGPREFRLAVWRAMLRAALEYRLHGEPGLQSVTDPWGKGPFAFRRFVFEGVDRGFELKSAYRGSGFQETLIFVEKEGTPFRCDGPHVGEALPKAGTRK